MERGEREKTNQWCTHRPNIKNSLNVSVFFYSSSFPIIILERPFCIKSLEDIITSA